MTIAIAHRDANGRLTFSAPAPKVLPPVKKREFWTEKLDARLRILAPDYSATQIANILGTTRNAVIGRCHRQGINLKKTVKAEPVEKARRSPRPRVASPPPAPRRPKSFATFGGETDAAKVDQIAAARAVDRDARMAATSADWSPVGVPFMKIRDGLCRWPLWTGSTPFADKLFCGIATDGQVYCARCIKRGTAPKTTKWMDTKLGIDKARAA